MTVLGRGDRRARPRVRRSREHTVRHTDKRICVRAIDVERAPADVLQEVDALAAVIAA